MDIALWSTKRAAARVGAARRLREDVAELKVRSSRLLQGAAAAAPPRGPGQRRPWSCLALPCWPPLLHAFAANHPPPFAPCRPQAVKAARDASEAAARRLGQQSSEVGDDRPVGGCAFSSGGELLATCGWGGAVNIWRVEDGGAAGAGAARVRGFRAHPERATGICWHPEATVGLVRRQWGVAGRAAARMLKRCKLCLPAINPAL
jgi:hypothetical protein